MIRGNPCGLDIRKCWLRVVTMVNNSNIVWSTNKFKPRLLKRVKTNHKCCYQVRIKTQFFRVAVIQLLLFK